jgi:hypothetical protein
MFYINHEYLSGLEHPHEAITEDVWRSWRSTLLDKSVSSESHGTLLTMPIRTIATNVGVIWKTEAKDKINEILQQDFTDIKDRKHVGDWIKKAITLTFAKLVELDNEQMEKVVTLPPSEKELLELARQDAYNEARILINKTVVQMRQETTNENFEELFKEFIKLVLGELSMIGTFTEERLRRYIPVAYDRFYNMLNIEDITNKYDIQHGVVNNIFNRFGEDFATKIMSTSDELTVFNKKYIAYYEHVFETLDRTDLVKWGERLKMVKRFSK